MHRKRAWRILGILKKSVEVRTRLRTGRVDFQSPLRPDEFVCYGCHTCWEADGKASIERLCISLPYVETFNSKGYLPELRSRYVFFVFRDSYVLCKYVMNILCTFHTNPYHGCVTQSDHHQGPLTRWLCYPIYIYIIFCLQVILITVIILSPSNHFNNLEVSVV